jgi:hypothetical protein
MGPGACLSLSAILVFSGAWKGFPQIDAVGHEAADGLDDSHAR